MLPLFYLKPWHHIEVVWVHVAIMFCLWAAAIVALGVLGRRIVSAPLRQDVARA